MEISSKLNSPASPLILVIDDDPDTRENLCDILELDGYQHEAAGTAAELLGREAWDEVSLVLLDRKVRREERRDARDGHEGCDCH